MSKKMLINATHPEENRVAIVEDGILTELDIEIAGKEQTKGNIYKAVVVRVEPGLQAAFIDYGGERLGFLQMGELHPSYFRPHENGEGKSRPRITDVLRRGQELLVQIVKEERGTKGAALTTFLSLPGRYMVFMPDSDTKGVSRKIEDDGQRRKLKEIMASLDLPADMGYIVRTAGIGQKKEELKKDFDYLVRVYENIKTHGRQAKAPALIYKESNLMIRSIRDYFSSDMDEVLVDDPKVYQEARDFFNEVMPEYARLVKLHQERRPIFSRYQIEEQIETIVRNKVPLTSGGSIVIDSTEALVAIDVNSGKMAGEQGVESTAYKTNLEAAVEVGRQLRLRDLGGLIVIDFIDMRDRKHIRDVEKALKDSLKYDKARVTVGRISQFGLMEMSRQRIKATLAEGSYLSCPHCQGSGRIKSAEAQAIAFLRKIQSGLAKGQIGRIEGEVPLEVATYLLNMKREELVDMERRHQIVLIIKGRPDFIAGQVELTFHKREKEELLMLAPAEGMALALIPMPVTEEAASPPAPPALSAALPEIAPEGGEELKKKRKRRRKKKDDEADSVPSGPMHGERDDTAAVPDTAGAQQQATPAQEETETAMTPAAATEELPVVKKRRRSRRKKKPALTVVDPAQQILESDISEEPSAAAEASALEVETITPESAGSESVRKKRRRRKKKQPQDATQEEHSSNGQPVEHAPADSPGGGAVPVLMAVPSGSDPLPVPDQPIDAPENAPEPATLVPKKRPARSKKPKAAPVADAAYSDPEMPAGESAAEPAPAKKRVPRPRSRKKVENKEVAVELEETTAE
jgi:ribonuclease E